MKKFIFGLLAGISAGILFAPKSGKRLREQLKKSNTRFTDFSNALLEAGKDAGSEVQEFIESDDMKSVLTSGRKTVEDFASVLEEKGGELSKKAQGELNKLVEDAIGKAKKAKTVVEGKASEMKGAAVKKAKNVKKTAEKKVTTAKKSAKKVIRKVKK